MILLNLFSGAIPACTHLGDVRYQAKSEHAHLQQSGLIILEIGDVHDFFMTYITILRLGILLHKPLAKIKLQTRQIDEN